MKQKNTNSKKYNDSLYGLKKISTESQKVSDEMSETIKINK